MEAYFTYSKWKEVRFLRDCGLVFFTLIKSLLLVSCVYVCMYVF